MRLAGHFSGHDLLAMFAEATITRITTLLFVRFDVVAEYAVFTFVINIAVRRVIRRCLLAGHGDNSSMFLVGFQLPFDGRENDQGRITLHITPIDQSF